MINAYSIVMTVVLILSFPIEVMYFKKSNSFKKNHPNQPLLLKMYLESCIEFITKLILMGKLCPVNGLLQLSV